MKNIFQQGDIEVPKAEKLSFWRKLGGGALSIAIIIHVILAIGGGIWVSRIPFPFAGEPIFVAAIPPPEELTTATTKPRSTVCPAATVRLRSVPSCSAISMSSAV